MPKVKKEKPSKRVPKPTKGVPTEAWLSGDRHFKIIDDDVFCDLCKKNIECTKKSDIKKHAMTASHLLFKGTHADFKTDLADTLMHCNISRTKIHHPAFVSFFEKYCTDQKLPDELTFRKHYTEKVYSSIIEGVRTDVSDNNIWISIIETTDSEGRYVCHFAVGKLNAEPTKFKLLCTKYLEDTDYKTIHRFTFDALLFLYGSFVELDKNKKKILCLITDATPYMVAAGKKLLEFFPNIKHVTCVALALERLEEDISASFSAVDDLITNVKIVFTKAPHRVEKYKSVLPEAPLPPEPNLIESGSWLNAALFYEQYFDSIKSIVNSFDNDEEDEVCIYEAQKSFGDNNTLIDLKFIKDNFSIISKAMKKFETSNLTLNEAIGIIKQVKTKLDAIYTSNNLLSVRFNNFIANNFGFHILDNIDVTNTNPIYKYCPIAMVNIRQTFSTYINNYTKSKKDLTQENIEKLFIVHYYHFNKNDDVIS